MREQGRPAQASPWATPEATDKRAFKSLCPLITDLGHRNGAKQGQARKGMRCWLCLG